MYKNICGSVAFSCAVDQSISVTCRFNKVMVNGVIGSAKAKGLNVWLFEIVENGLSESGIYIKLYKQIGANQV